MTAFVRWEPDWEGRPADEWGHVWRKALVRDEEGDSWSAYVCRRCGSVGGMKMTAVREKACDEILVRRVQEE
jgi:hypothetical protein